MSPRTDASVQNGYRVQETSRHFIMLLSTVSMLQCQLSSGVANNIWHFTCFVSFGVQLDCRGFKACSFIKCFVLLTLTELLHSTISAEISTTTFTTETPNYTSTDPYNNTASFSVSRFDFVVVFVVVVAVVFVVVVILVAIRLLPDQCKCKVSIITIIELSLNRSLINKRVQVLTVCVILICSGQFCFRSREFSWDIWQRINFTMFHFIWTKKPKDKFTKIFKNSALIHSFSGSAVSNGYD